MQVQKIKKKRELVNFIDDKVNHISDDSDDLDE